MASFKTIVTRAHVICKAMQLATGDAYWTNWSAAMTRAWSEAKTGAFMVGGFRTVQAKVRIAKERQNTLRIAEGFLRSRLNLKGEFPVSYLTAKSFSKNTMGHIVHGDNPRIELRNQKSLRETVACLAHELVHAQQVERGSLEVPSHGVRVWEGKRMLKGKTYEAYRATPWEAEAFDKMYVLADEFLATM